MARFLLVIAAGACCGAEAGGADTRDVHNAYGTIFSAGNGTGYSDQPQVVIFNASYWLCVITCSLGHEGQRSQIAGTTISTDRGRTWSHPPTSIEPLPEHGAARVAASWINPLHIAATGRLYVFYTFNAGNTTRWPSGRPVSNSNLLGGQFYRHSDDAGMTWSARAAVRIRSTRIDSENAFRGKVLQGWSVGKPFLASDGTAYLQYTKCGCPPAQAGSCEDVVSYDEAWLFASADIAAATGSVQPTFATLPAGDVGLLAHNRTQPGVGPGVGSEVVGAGVGSEGPDPSCKLAQLAGCYTQTGCTAAAQNASASDACFAATVNPDWGTCVTVSCTSPGGGAWRCPQNTTGCSGGTTGYSRDAAMTATAPPNNVMPTPTGAGSWIAEEGNLVEMGNHTPAHLYYAYRTSDGYLGVGTSVDGGLTFNAPMYGGYSRSVPGEANRLKNPRGPITPRRVFGNRYLLLYFNRGDGGIEGSRNPYWLAAGTYAPARQTIAWSQPEIVLYTTYAVPSPSGAVPVGTKLGYPDLFQDGEDIYVTETDKITARIHKLDSTLVAGLLAQGTASGQPTAIAPVLSLAKPAGKAATVASPIDGIDVSRGGSVTVEAWVELDPDVPLAAPLPVIVCGDTQGTGPLLHFFAPGAHAEATALTALFRHTSASAVISVTSQNLALFSGRPVQVPTARLHQVALVFDGQAQIVSFLVDGVLLDGGGSLGTGFFELAVLLNRTAAQLSGDAQGISSVGQPSVPASCSVGARVRSIRVYGSSNAKREPKRGFLRVSELAASFRDGPPFRSQ